jgi:hypothetical protein
VWTVERASSSFGDTVSVERLVSSRILQTVLVYVHAARLQREWRRRVSKTMMAWKTIGVVERSRLASGMDLSWRR